MRGAGPLAVAALALGLPASGQVIVPDRGRADTNMEAGELTSLAVGIRPGWVLSIGGELYEGLRPGVSIGVETGVVFDDRYVVRLAFSRSAHGDDVRPLDPDGNASGRPGNATVADLSLEPGMTRSVGAWRLDGGLVVAYTWLSRDAQVEREGGWSVGGSARLTRALSERVDVGVGLSMVWSMFPTPELENDPLADPDGRAPGHRLGLGIHLGYRWARPVEGRRQRVLRF